MSIQICVFWRQCVLSNVASSCTTFDCDVVLLDIVELDAAVAVLTLDVSTLPGLFFGRDNVLLLIGVSVIGVPDTVSGGLMPGNIAFCV